MTKNYLFTLLALALSARAIEIAISPAALSGLNDACPVLDAPVCGKNDKTYQNACFLARAGVQKAYDGWCGKADAEAAAKPDNFSDKTEANGYLAPNIPYVSCPCNYNFKPVCGSNGVTFANACRANCKRVPIVAYGECRLFNIDAQPAKTCECDYNNISVCATNNITYENSCVAKCFSATFKTNGICDAPCSCQFFFRPACGQNGFNYVNQCELDCAGVAKYADGLCSEVRSCGKCFGPIKRVCGRDEKTYDNECYASCAGTKIEYLGNCVTREHGKCQCPSIYLPVCGEDGSTYSNQCQMNCAGVTLRKFGKCKTEDKDSDKCRRNSLNTNYEPVCGSNVVTYYNKQMIGCDSGISVLYEGQCKPVFVPNCNCPRDLTPVCGVDGRTYYNKCVAKFAKVEIYVEGTCELNGNGWKVVFENKPVASPTWPAYKPKPEQYELNNLVGDYSRGRPQGGDRGYNIFLGSSRE